MKRLIVCLILLIISVGLYSQERVNGRPRYRFNSTSGTINSSSIVYWNYKNERWKETRQSPNNDGYFKNLSSICVKTVAISDTTYNILVLSYNDRYYKRLSSGYIYDSYKVQEKRLCILEKDQLEIIKSPTEELSIIAIEKSQDHLVGTNIDTVLWDLFKGPFPF